MSETYRVWVQVERIRTGDVPVGAIDEYVNIGHPDWLADFTSFEEAAAFIRSLPGWDQQSDCSDFAADAAFCPECNAHVCRHSRMRVFLTQDNG